MVRGYDDADGECDGNLGNLLGRRDVNINVSNYVAMRIMVMCLKTPEDCDYKL